MRRSRSVRRGWARITTVVYSEEKNKLKVTVDGVDKDGKPTYGVWVGQPDGKTYKMKENLLWDAAAYKVVNDHTYGITEKCAPPARARSRSMAKRAPSPWKGQTRMKEIQNQGRFR